MSADHVGRSCFITVGGLGWVVPVRLLGVSWPVGGFGVKVSSVLPYDLWRSQ